MNVANRTRFVPALLPIEDRSGHEQWVVILKASYRIVPGGPALPGPAAAIEWSDRFVGEPYVSSLLCEDDLAPYKPRSDVIVHAVAHAPGGTPSRRWPVRVEVGSLVKVLEVTGPRAWTRSLRGFKLGEPQLCTEVPLRYEVAYGGAFGAPGEERQLHQHNPAGLGYVPSGSRPSGDVVPAPQIEDPADPIGDIDRAYVPQGLGPIARTWQPRRARIGTTDERWKAERAPRLPLDFDDAFYNCAHPDLVYPGFLRGDELVTLEGLAAERLSFSLPDDHPSIELAPEQAGPRLELDTLSIDVAERTLSLTWRGMFLPEFELEGLVIH
jgi:hypothetical protein